MREILFKAKRIDNGEWVEGFYCKWIKGKRVITYSEKEVDCIITWMSNGGMQRFEVDPSTICQCTGLKDKNGKLIWENDIVNAKVTQNTGFCVKKYNDSYQVSYHEKYCYFYLKRKGNNLLFDGNWSYFVGDFEVIGNIFDNQELMNE